jgi:hypothetical protein
VLRKLAAGGCVDQAKAQIMQTKFPEVSKVEWLAKVEADLKGKPLSSLDFEVGGQAFSPIHHQDDLDALPQPIRSSANCRLGVFIEVEDPVEANKLALEALVGGANYIYFYDAGGSGTNAKDILYKGILTDIVDVVWHTAPKPFLTYNAETAAKWLALFSIQRGPQTIWIQFGHNHLENIALLRAVRLCINLILEETGESHSYQIGVVVEGNEADPNAAKIKSTAQAMAAINGGADILMVKPSDGIGTTPFERRIARNVHHLLSEEANFDQVADPAAGSYYIEALTDHLAQKIWSKFQQFSNDSSNKSSNDGNSA